MKIISDNKKQWYIHFYGDLYSMPLYKNYNTISELCEDIGAKRYTFELYCNQK